MKVVVIVLLLAVLVSLFSGLAFLVRDSDKQDSTRLLRSLKIRVALSIVLILFLVLSFALGWIEKP